MKNLNLLTSRDLVLCRFDSQRRGALRPQNRSRSQSRCLATKRPTASAVGRESFELCRKLPASTTMGTASASASTVAMSTSTEGTSTTEATSTASEAASTTTEGTSTAAEATSTTIEGTSAATEATSTSTGVTVTEPTAISSASGKGATASIVAPPTKATSPIEVVPTPTPPRPDANKDSAREPARSIVTVGRACVRVIGVVTIRARRRRPGIIVDLTPIARIHVTLIRIRITLISIALIRIRIAWIPVAWIPVPRLHRRSSLGIRKRCN